MNEPGANERYSLERIVAHFEEFLGRDLTHHERIFFDEGYRWGRVAEREGTPETSETAPDARAGKNPPASGESGR